MQFTMQFLIAIILSLMSLVEATSTVFALAPEPTGVPTVNTTNALLNGTMWSNATIHNHGGAICPSAYHDAGDQGRINEGIKYLRGKRGSQCSARPVADKILCARVSCSWKSAIYVCNDDHVNYVTPDCGAVADYAQLVVDACTWSNPAVWAPMTQGEVWDDDHWHVYVGYGNC